MLKLRDIDHKIIKAVREKDLITTHALIKAGANVDAAIRTEQNMHLGDQICNLLSIACIGSDPSNKDSYEVVKLLLANGAKADTQPSDSLSALMYASFFDASIIKLLLDAGADKIINHKTEEGWTALMYAANNVAPAVKILCEHGADIHAQNDDGQSALHYAVYNKIDVCRELLKHGADPNLPNAIGNTPLMVAAHCNFRDMADFLERNGGDSSIANNNGKTPKIMLEEHAKYSGLDAKKQISRGLDI